MDELLARAVGRGLLRAALPHRPRARAHRAAAALHVRRDERHPPRARSQRRSTSIYAGAPTRSARRARALGKILDLELAIMLHTYREDLIAQQARSERLATFGQLVGSIGHELRNPLGVIESSLYILQGRVGERRARAQARRPHRRAARHRQPDHLRPARHDPRPAAASASGCASAALVDSVLAAIERPAGGARRRRGRRRRCRRSTATPSKLRQVLRQPGRERGPRRRRRAARCACAASARGGEVDDRRRGHRARASIPRSARACSSRSSPPRPRASGSGCRW